MTKKVLLCDDEIHILRAAEMKVSQSGYEVRMARDGQEAWEMILEELPDALVTDVQMPRLDGLELTRRIRNNPITKDLPVLLLTARGFELTSQVAELGLTDIMTKPFSPRELAKVVDRMVAAREAAAT